MKSAFIAIALGISFCAISLSASAEPTKKEAAGKEAGVRTATFAMGEACTRSGCVNTRPPMWPRTAQAGRRDYCKLVA